MNREKPVTINPAICPLCGRVNQCASASGAIARGESCWCMDTAIPAAAIEKVPQHLKNKQCICANCARIYENTRQGKV